MAAKLSTANKPKFNTNALLPSLLTSGPVLTFMGLQQSRTRVDWFAVSLEFAGAVLLMLGLGLLFIKQRRLERRLDEIERLKS